MEISTRYYYSRQQKIFYTYVLRRQSTVMVHFTLPHQCLTRYSLSMHFSMMSCFRWYSPYYPKETPTATYNRFFTLLKDISSRHSLNFSPRRVTFDFECASRNAATDTFPSADLLRFLFHYAKTIWRKTQNGGLQTAYKDVPDVTKLVRRAACLPLLPLNKVEDFWLSHWRMHHSEMIAPS